MWVSECWHEFTSVQGKSRPGRMCRTWSTGGFKAFYWRHKPKPQLNKWFNLLAPTKTKITLESASQFLRWIKSLNVSNLCWNKTWMFGSFICLISTSSSHFNNSPQSFPWVQALLRSWCQQGTSNLLQLWLWIPAGSSWILAPNPPQPVPLTEGAAVLLRVPQITELLTSCHQVVPVLSSYGPVSGTVMKLGHHVLMVCLVQTQQPKLIAVWI